ncbi:MAG: glycoside hydrolase family 36 N-terminal domain-containing protein, partial [Nakamurella sp.]
MTPPPTSSTFTLDDTATPTTNTGSAVRHLRAAGVSVVIDCQGPRLPRIVHWGADLGELDQTTLDNLVRADIQAVVSNVPDLPISPSLLAEHSTGWMGLPGLIGHRGGRSWSTLFELTRVTSHLDPDGSQRVLVDAGDQAAGLELSLTLELTPAGVLRTRGTVTSIAGHSEQAYS